MAVLLVQALCPDRHCIMAVASEEMAAEKSLALLKAGIAGFLDRGAINPWCGLCGAKADTWHYEIGRTRFASMEEAMPVLRQAEEGQQMYARIQKAAGVAYDKEPGAEN